MQYITTNIIWIVLVLVVVWVILAYNGIIRLVSRTKEAWSDIDVQLKRRYNLIPNLVNTVKGYAQHEKQVFENVTLARARAEGSETREEKAKNENQLTNTLKTLFAVAENYPDLKANANFLELQTELSDTENKIQAARRFYNSLVRDLNIRIQSFPYNIIAGIFKFNKEEFFGIDEEKAQEREVVDVDFSKEKNSEVKDIKADDDNKKDQL